MKPGLLVILYMRASAYRRHGLGAVLGLGIVGVSWSQGLDTESGVRAWLNARHAQATDIWRPLAMAGDIQAQRYLAYAYRLGAGVERDDGLAAYWYRKAADQGLADAQYQLGLMYELGIGVSADPDEAERWYALAVGQGFCPGELSAGGVLGD